MRLRRRREIFRGGERPSLLARIGRLLRAVLLALIVAFLFGFVIGTCLRREIDRPVRYYGAVPIDCAPDAGPARPDSLA